MPTSASASAPTARRVGGPAASVPLPAEHRHRRAFASAQSRFLPAAVAVAGRLLAVAAAEAHVSVTVLGSDGDAYVAAGGGKVKSTSRKILVGDRYTGFVKFDLSVIPADAIVHDARLRLFVVSSKRGGGSTQISVHRVESEWSESDVHATISPAVESQRTVDATLVGDYVEW